MRAGPPSHPASHPEGGKKSTQRCGSVAVQGCWSDLPTQRRAQKAREKTWSSPRLSSVGRANLSQWAPGLQSAYVPAMRGQDGYATVLACGQGP
jgi:hypothetical protein